MKRKVPVKRLFLKVLRVFLLAALVITCAGTPNANYGSLGKATDIVPLTARALTGALPNGLRYYIMENSRPENRAHLALAVNAGSVLEKDEERGIAHFVEHLAFNDTERFPKLELIEYLRSLGMRFGADANAYTSYDETVYHFDVPVEVKDGVKRIPDKALAIIDDWTRAVSFKPEDVAGEKRVVMEEYRARLDAGSRVRKTILPILFSGSPYAERDPIGLPEIIENAGPELLKGFYNRWYAADNMALVFVGDFDGKALQAELERHFTMPSPQKPVERPRYELPPPKKGNFRAEIITDPELTTVNFMIYFKQNPGAEKGTLAYYRETVIDYLIDTMLNLRFEEAKADPQAAATEAWGGIWRWSKNGRFYSMGTSPKTGNAEAALRELLLEKEAVRRYGFTEGELERAKLSLLSYLDKQLSEKDQQDSRSFIRGFTSHFLTGEDMADIEWEMETVSLLLPGIGVKEITAAAKNYFAAGDCAVFLTAPEAEAGNLPSKERIKTIFAETEKAKIKKRVSSALSEGLLDRKPPPGVIASESEDAETGAHILILGNGAKIILKETANKNNEIVMYAMAKGGTANAPEDEDASARLASEMVAISGLGPYSRAELIYKLAGKQVSFSFWAYPVYRGFQGLTTAKDAETLFEMIYLSFTESRLNESAVSAMLDQYRTSLAHADDDPQNVFSRAINTIMFGNHPRFRPLELADMDRVSIEQASAFVQRCVNPGDYVFVFTGNFNMAEMRKLCANYIASIPEGPSMNSWTDLRITRPGKIERKIYKGKEDKCAVYLNWISPGSEVFSEEKNQIAAILSGYLDIKLTNEIREKLGGVYSISTGANVTTIPAGEIGLEVYFNCGPGRSQELIAAVQDHVADIYKLPVDEDAFFKSKEALLKDYENSLQSNLYIAQSYANSTALYNTPLARLNRRADAIRNARPEDMQALCRDIVSTGPALIIMYPEDMENN
ncbi:MAG: insulinase family protein [Treponema sp.]|jgi:zinc protease|nr:insulinase family protein [Treponema sp.]